MDFNGSALLQLALMGANGELLDSGMAPSVCSPTVTNKPIPRPKKEIAHSEISRNQLSFYLRYSLLNGILLMNIYID